MIRRVGGILSLPPCLTEVTYLNTFLRLDQNSPRRQIVGRQLQFDLVARRQAGERPARLSRHEGPQPVSVDQLHLIRSVRQSFNYDTFNFEGICSGHVKISGSPSVINTVCSKWADSEPSCVTTVQPSFKIFTPGWPALTIGSIAKVMPGRNF